MGKAWGAVALVGLLTGCSASQDIASSQAAIATFHQQLNAGDFSTIYEQASGRMKSATSQPEFTTLLSAIHRKLGAFQSGKSAGWNDSVTTGGHFLSMGYRATYEKGAADESFTFLVSGDHASLAGYHINSTALIVN